MITILVVAEDVLRPHDVDRLAHLYDEPMTVHVMVPFRESGLVESLDDIARGHRPGDDDVPDADQEAVASRAADASVEALRAAGVEAVGTTAPGDPVDAIKEAADRIQADEVWVLTEPHLIGDGFRRDWASRVRREVPLPVLHVVSGTDQVVS